MIRLGRLISLAQLKRRRGTRGQIAIFMLLAVGVVLVFALATANLGAVSTTAIRMDNAADAAALDLSSELATRSNQLWEALGETEGRCQRTGILPMFLAVVLAVIAVITFQPELLVYAVMIAAAAGAVGGAIGGAILHGNLKGALQGAIQGAAIGAAIGAAYVTVGAAFGTWGAVGAEVGATSLTLITPSAAGAAAGAVVSGASSIYTGAVKEQLTAKSFAVLAKALNGLPDDVRLRESAIFQAMSQVVDDPNRVPDRLDSDEDGDVQALVPAFQHFWAEHLRAVKARVEPPPSEPSIGARIKDFATGRQGLSEFAQEARKFLRWFEREEIECGPPGRGVEGAAVSLWRALYEVPQYRMDIEPFWRPEPYRDALLGWYEAECRLTGCATGCRVVGCPNPPPGYDEVDGVSTELKSLIEAASGIMQPQEPGLTPEELQNLARASQAWLNIFADDDPDSNGDFLETLPGVEQAIRRWITKTEQVRGSLPGCRLAYGPTVDSNLVGPGGIDPGFDERNPLYPCVWGRPPSNPRTGTYLQTPPNVPHSFCKIYDPEKRELTNQVNTVTQVVNNLEQRIKETYRPTCPVGDFVRNDRVSNLEASLSDNTLRYTFDVTFTCHECHEVESRCSVPCPPPAPCPGPNPCPPPPTECTTSCRVTVCSDPQFPATGVGGSQPNIGAPDLSFPVNLPSPMMPSGQITGTVLPGFQSTIDDVTARSGGTFATIDQDPEDEFYPVLVQLRGAQTKLTAFLAALLQFNQGMQGSQEAVAREMANLGSREAASLGAREGANPGEDGVTYTWRDSRGEHSVRVRVGPFRFAEIGSKKSGNIFWGKKCLVLDNYYDQETAWVEITRQDPTQAMGFWNWGGFHGGRITRCASGNYSHDHVTLWDKCPRNR